MNHRADENMSDLLAGIADAASRPFERAMTLPPQAYCAPALHELEQVRIFAREWICVGRAEEIVAPGDFFTTRVAGEPIIVLRNEAGEIRTLSNVCRHKWTQLLEGSGNTRRIVCPYHAWTYDLDGCLLHARFMEHNEVFDAGQCTLPAVECDQWRGFVFVRLDGDGSSLAEQLAGLDTRTCDYHMEDMDWICGDEEVWACNWKLLAENFTETYHVFHTHRDSIARYTPVELTEIMDGDHAHSFGSNRLLKDALQESPFEPHHPELSEAHANEFSMVGIYPAQMLALAPDRVFYMCLTPLDAGRVRTKWGVACYDRSPDAQTVQSLERLYRLINEEDRVRLERVQTSVASRYARTAPISRYEKMNWEFSRYLASRLEAKA